MTPPTRSLPLLAWALATAGALASCEDHFTVAGADAGTDVADAAVPLFHGRGKGETCGAASDCRSGLDCQAGACVPAATKAENAACLLSAECKPGLQCGFFGFCVAEGASSEGMSCTSVSDCKRGLFCDLKGISGFCSKPGKELGDLHAPCTTTAACEPGLHCSKTQGSCQPGSLPLSTDLFSGVACPEAAEAAMPFQARNVVPRKDKSTDFYSTPFPNDVWLAGGKVDLSRHPRPGPGLIGLDVAGATVDAIGAEMDGFSTAPTVYVRFTRAIDPASIVPSGPKQNVFLVDLTSNTLLEFTHSFHAQRNKYICGNWLAIHPRWSKIVAPRHTFAVVITDDIRAVLAAGAPAADAIAKQGDDLPALLGATKPADAALGPAWDAYAKVRKWIGDKKIAAAKVVAATSFTTTDPLRVYKKFRAAATATKAPAIVKDSVFVCGGANKGKKSPCIDPAFAVTNPGKPDPRDCPANADTLPFTEIHLKLELPVWQHGARPYLAGGGGLKLGKDFAPTAAGTEPVCAALTIPKGKTMPAGGWPLLIFAHGTGGSLRSGPADMGEAAVNFADGATKLATAVLSIDQPMHGSRRGAPLDPGPLFYNFANPPAAKGNVYQGVADNFALVRFAKAYSGTLPAVGAVKFDGAKIAFMGHSQGGTTGPLWLPFAQDGGKRDILGAVFSGTGGGLVFSLLNKKSPDDATVGIKIALQEGDLDEWHPVLALMQFYFDETDPFSVAHLYYREPLGVAYHVLHTFGQGDTYTPPQTSRVFAAATGGLLLEPGDAGPWFDKIGDLGMSLQKHDKAVSGNIKGKDGVYTGVTIQHDNNKDQSTTGQAYDGHFVAFKDKVCNAQVKGFLGSLFAGKVPVVPAP